MGFLSVGSSRRRQLFGGPFVVLRVRPLGVLQRAERDGRSHLLVRQLALRLFAALHLPR